MKLLDLASHKDTLDAIELGCWLHNLGKLSPEFMKRPGSYQQWPKKDNSYIADNDLKGLISEYGSIRIASGGATESISLEDLIRANKRTQKSSLMQRLIARCHGDASGMEKRSVQKEKRETEGDEFQDPYLRSQLPEYYPRYGHTPFGFPFEAYRSANDLQGLQDTACGAAKDVLESLFERDVDRRPLFDRLAAALVPGLADSQIPIADVRIYDVGLVVGAMMKAAVAGWLLGEAAPDPDQLQWRLLRFAVDVPSFAERAVRLADIDARRRKLNTALDALTRYLQDELCFATPIYRDEYGVIFWVPETEDWEGDLAGLVEGFWLKGKAGAGIDVAYRLFYSEVFGLGPRKGYSHQIGSLLAEPAPSPHPSWERIRDAWQGKVNAEVCPTCQVNPLGDESATLGANKSFAHRQACPTCLRTRSGRVIAWRKNPDRTMWVDELMDANGRVAVVSARFDLQPWLMDRDKQTGSYLETTILRNWHADLNVAPSSARVQRLVETTRGFWSAAEQNILGLLGYRSPRIRLTPAGGKIQLAENAGYDLRSKYDGLRIGAVWTGSSFVVITSEAYLRSRLTKDRFELLANGESEFEIMEPSGYFLAVRNHGTAKLRAGRWTNSGYSPYLRLQLDPRRFQCLVPADQAFDVAQAISLKYSREMARVRDRLELDVSVIVANAEIPVRAMLDAARRTMEVKHEVRDAELASVVLESAAWLADGSHPAAAHVQFRDGSCWKVPLNFDFPTQYVTNGMGQVSTWGSLAATPDYHFPFFTLIENGESRLAHALELSGGSRLRVRRSSFDFEYLDSSSRRFELSYDSEGRRRPLQDPVEDRSNRPYAIDQIHDLRSLARLLAERFSTRQLKFLDGLVAAKQAAWQQTAEEMSIAFVGDILANMERLPHRPELNVIEKALLLRAAQYGLLRDAIEISLGVEKGNS